MRCFFFSLLKFRLVIAGFLNEIFTERRGDVPEYAGSIPLGDYN